MYVLQQNVIDLRYINISHNEAKNLKNKKQKLLTT